MRSISYVLGISDNMTQVALVWTKNWQQNNDASAIRESFYNRSIEKNLSTKCHNRR